MPVIRKQYRQEKVDPYALLLSRIKTNLRIILSLPPQHHLLSTAIRYVQCYVLLIYLYYFEMSVR